MRVEVKLFARARDAVGADTVSVELPQHAMVKELKTELAAQYPGLAALAPHLLVAVGHDYARDNTPLEPEAMIACFPPVSGG